MTTEDDFQRTLDAHPDDWQTRLVFADWLEEHCDLRAAGYRALGRARLYAARCELQNQDDEPTGEVKFAFGDGSLRDPAVRAKWERSLLPLEWLNGLPVRDKYDRDSSWRYFATRREAEDAAVVVFATLPGELSDGTSFQ